MFKLFTVYLSLLIINYIMLVNTLTYNCIHDDITLQDISVSEMSYRERRSRRNLNNVALFEPLNVHVHISDLDKSLSKKVVMNIDTALKKVTSFISQIIKVKQTMKPFHLERNSCSQKWRSGLNKGKCSRMKSGPEFCSTKETDFVIPVQYLNKLQVFDKSALHPVFTIESGIGVNDSNFILFVISRTTSWCEKSGVQAYGSYCRLDKSYRPTAGLLNLCPENFSKQIFKPDHYFNVIMHEMFHILGFSKHLYSKFKTCTSNHSCQPLKKFISKDKDGVQRLIFPEIVQSMQAHFGCSEDEFGAPLENLTDVNSTNEYSSHWHPLLMYSSIMTPSLQQDDYVVIDNISLSLLASTGWYKIDFSKAQSFIFGEGEGCNFGRDCKKSKYLCEPNNKTGCDISQQTIGRCEKVVPYHSCGIYKPNNEESCVEDEKRLSGMNYQHMEFQQRCIMLQRENDSSLIPTCMVLTCKTSTSINLLIDGTWIDCENQNQVLINNISVNCPNERSFCLTRGSEISEMFCSLKNKKFAISLEMFFQSPLSSDLSDAQNYKKFKVDIVEAIASHIDIPANYIVNSSLYTHKYMYLSFVICLPTNMNNSELGALMKRTQDFLKSSLFTSIFKGKKELAIASVEIQVDSELAITFSDNEGFNALVIVPVVCVIFVIATFIASVMRHVIIQKHKPKRETVELKERSDDASLTV